ncbi:PfkB family carbohydrate kinase [Jannaschia sp. CCS1]|uniref:PfkB family carbohydrate kinase n=1 Tax=Jannaschia sp. (strain CCS1) TaxID=290400 RepID=UPI000053BA9E|nr:PfkB family carbohydrate kinase [Jannaschia sp. CCS1]ABD55026.1 PfkB [Jannaschia sp. CCS1]
MSLLVVGALHWDVVVQASRLPRIDETLRGSGVTYQFGGKAGNQAIAAAGAGADVGFAGRNGTDEAGQSMQAALQDAGVDIAQLQAGAGASGMSVAILMEDGNYGAVIVSAENHMFDVDAVQIPDECRLVLLQNEMAAGVIPAMATKAQRAGAGVILNAAPAQGVGKTDLAHLHTLIVNRVEGADLLGIADSAPDPVAVVNGLQELAPQALVILTLGGDGVVFAEPGRAVQSQAARRVSVHSTHGAGDVFVGAYAAAILAGQSLSEAIQLGQAAAAAHISQIR